MNFMSYDDSAHMDYEDSYSSLVSTSYEVKLELVVILAIVEVVL